MGVSTSYSVWSAKCQNSPATNRTRSDAERNGVVDLIDNYLPPTPTLVCEICQYLVESATRGVTVGVSFACHDASWVRGFRPGTTDPQWLLSTG